MNTDPRFGRNAGMEVFTGSELLVKGALETVGGVQLFAGCQDSTATGVFDALRSLGDLADDAGMVTRMAPGADAVAGMMHGALSTATRTMAMFDAARLPSLSDVMPTPAQLNRFDSARALVVCFDQPIADDQRLPADVRHLTLHLGLPTVEPCCPQELKDWVALSYQLTTASGCIGYLVGPTLSGGGGSAICHPNAFDRNVGASQAAPVTQRDIEAMRQSTRDRVRQADQSITRQARELGINRLLHRPQKDEVVPFGFIAVGRAYAPLAHALDAMGLAGRMPILKLGLIHPLDESLVREFARSCRQLLVIEEGQAFVERMLPEALRLLPTTVPPPAVFGKQFPGDTPGLDEREAITPNLLLQRLIPIVRSHPTLPIELTNGRLAELQQQLESTERAHVEAPPRSPNFCAGCPQRDASSVLLDLQRDLDDTQYMADRHGAEPIALRCFGDAGCNALMQFPPNDQLLGPMPRPGQSAASAAGARSFDRQKQIVFMGHATFQGGGRASISEAIAESDDVTFVLLDNRSANLTTDRKRLDDEVDLAASRREAVSLERAVQSLVPKENRKDVLVVRIDPTDLDRYRQLMERTVLSAGVKVVILDKECGVTFHRRRENEAAARVDELGYLPRQHWINIDPEVCDNCLECTQRTGCPGLTFAATDYGTKVQTDLSACVNDGACQRTHACPSFEKLLITRRAAPTPLVDDVELRRAPPAAKPVHATKDVWRCFIAGVGGMRVGRMASVLIAAGNAMGYHVQFFDRRGMAVRGGSVTSQIVFTRRQLAGIGREGAADLSLTAPNAAASPHILHGDADLLLGVDLLEAARAIDPAHGHRIASPQRTAAVVNIGLTPTVQTLVGQQQINAQELDSGIRLYTDQDHHFSFDVSDAASRLMGNTKFVNAMVLGIAFQKGLLPMTQQAFEAGVRAVVAERPHQYVQAFQLGRCIAAEPGRFVTQLTPHVESPRQAYQRFRRAITQRAGRRKAKAVGELMRNMFRDARRKVSDALRRDAIIRVYDCYRWGGLAYARRYVELVRHVFALDTSSQGYALTRGVVWSAAHVMLIKDAVYVARLLTDPAKYARDRKRFNVDESRGDRIRYRHLLRPGFDLFGRTIQIDWRAHDWHLRLIARLPCLRRLLRRRSQACVDFRDWFLQRVGDMHIDPQHADRDYRRWLEVVRTPLRVTGWRAIRQARLAAARREIEALLSIPAARFDPDRRPDPLEQDDAALHLPVLTPAN